VDPCAHKKKKHKTPSLISVLGSASSLTGHMMVDGVNFPLLPAVTVRPLSLSGLSMSERASSLWQQENSGSRPQKIIEESWGVLREKARMREPLLL